MGLIAALTWTAATLAQPPSVSTLTPAPAAPYQLPPAKLAQAKALGKIRPAIHFGAEFWEVGALWLLLSSGIATQLSKWAASRTTRRWLQAAIFSALIAALLFVVVDLPVAAIGHAFSLHYRIGIEGWAAWLLDQAKTVGLTVLVETPLLMLASYLMRWHWSRRHYWLWFAAATVPMMLLFTFLLPPLIEPIFYDFEPLAQSHPALVQNLERVVARTGTSIPPDRMFLMKASEKSNGLNAYVSGLGSSKRIVVWDTTADRMSMDEILLTFAHETGHYVLHHIAKGLALGSIGIFALLWAVSVLAGWLVRRFGRSWQVDSVASLPGLTVLLLAFALLLIVTEPIDNSISRHFEHEADVYGQEAIHGLVPDPQKTAVAAFSDLGAAYLDDPNPNAFVEFWSDSHPSTQSRAIFAAQYNPWAPGKKPQFFPK
jgi:Zn-dependent protease with chaperone function